MKINLKKKAFVFLLAMSMFFTACGNGNSENTNQESTKQEESSGTSASKQGQFTVAIDYMPTKLHSSFGEDSMTVITTPIYDPLFWDTKDGLDYRLADKLDVSDDGLVYTIHLNDKANWSDGKPITADDIIFSTKYSKIQNGGKSNYTTSKVSGKPIEINKVDDKTIEFKLPEVNNYFHISLSSMNVIPAHPFDGDASKVEESDYFIKPGMATSGAYTVEEVNKDSLVYKARDDYYREKPETDTVVMKVMGAGNARNVAMESGELSYARITNAQDLEKYKSQSDKYNIFSFPEGRLNYLQINPYSPALKGLNDDARKAIFLALNQQEIIDVVYGSNELATPANSILTPETYYYSEDVKGYEQNIEEAKKLADSSGLTGKTLIYNYNKDRAGMEDIATVIQQQLGQIGVNVQIEGLDSPTFFGKIFLSWDDNAEEQATWDLATNGWDSQRGLKEYTYDYLSQPKKWGWSEEIAKLITNKNGEPSLEKQKELGIEISQKANEEYWMYPFPYPNFVVATPKNVTGLDATHIVPEFGDYTKIKVE